MLRVANTTVSLTEVPDEVSLCITFSGCPYGCPECHSAELWGEHPELPVFTSEHLSELLNKYGDMVTCVCFFGGDWEAHTELYKLLCYASSRGYKVCLYSGLDVPLPNIMPYLDYLKLGHYDKNSGPLSDPKTNQRMYIVRRGFIVDNITHKFWRKQCS